MKVIIVNQPSKETEKRVFQKLYQFLSTAKVNENQNPKGA